MYGYAERCTMRRSHVFILLDVSIIRPIYLSIIRRIYLSIIRPINVSIVSINARYDRGALFLPLILSSLKELLYPSPVPQKQTFENNCTPNSWPTSRRLTKHTVRPETGF